MVQQRSIVTYVILSIVTCGIFGIYWIVCLTNDVGALSGDTRMSGGTTALLIIITCGLYGIYWAYKLGESIDAIKQSRGQSSGSSAILFVILYLVTAGIVSNAIMQNEVNQLV